MHITRGAEIFSKKKRGHYSISLSYVDPVHFSLSKNQNFVSITGSAGDTNYGAYTYENLGREPYWLSQKLQISNTGAGGFIASHIARHLKSEVHFIIASDWKKNKLMTEDMFTHEFHLVDLMMDYCLKVTKGVDHVFNLSADLGGMGFIQSNHSVIMCNNTMISFNIIEAARINGVKRYFSVKVKPSVLLSDMCIFMHLDLYRDTDTSGGVPYFYRCVCKKPEHYEA